MRERHPSTKAAQARLPGESPSVVPSSGCKREERLTPEPSAASSSEPQVELGLVTKPHGLRGELRVHLHCPDSKTLYSLDTLSLSYSGGEHVFEIESLRPGPKVLLLKLKGVESRTQAELLRGASISVPRAALPPPEPGEYYLVDLIAAQVIGPEGEIGVVEEVRTHPSVDTILIRTAAGTTVEQVLSKPWVQELNLAAKRVVLSSTDGML